MEFFDTIRQVRSNWNPYKKWEIEQQKKEKQNKLLRAKYPPTPQELEHAKQYGRTIVDVINTMDQHSIDKSEDAMTIINNFLSITSFAFMGIGAALGKAFKSLTFVKKNTKLQQPSILIGIMLGGTASSIIRNIWGAQIQKQASRIARYQTRKDDLKDSRNFVVYNKEQITQAEEIAKTLPEVEEKVKPLTTKESMNPIKVYSKAIKTTKSLKQDYSKYEKWKKNFSTEEAKRKENFKNIYPDKNDIIKAEKDKDVLLETIKQIETSSLNYIMNISLGLHLAFDGIIVGGIGLGAGTAKLLDILQKKKVLPEKSAAINMGKMAAPIAVPIALIVISSSFVAKVVKDAARVGRFKAKQDLLQHPQKYVVYTKEERDKIKNTQIGPNNEKSSWARFKEDLNAIKNYKKDYQEYQIYMKTQHKEELKLDEALKQIEISDKQKTEAKLLQKNSFHSFEKMDEKAQRFTDDTDAAFDTFSTITSSIVNVTFRIMAIFMLNKELALYNRGNFPKNIKEFYNLSKHLSFKKISLVIGTFMAPILVTIPLSIKGIQVKKDGGKIGVMTAMKDLDDPKNFLDSQEILEEN